MTLIDVLDFLEEKVDCPNWYAGKRSDTAEKSITVYPTDGVAPVLPLGGVDRGSYATKAFSVFVHWGKNVTAAEVKAQEIYDCLFGQTGTIGGKEVIKFDMRTAEPVGIGTDDKGIFEYVINFVIYYRKGK